jgi:hypothetical protein
MAIFRKHATALQPKGYISRSKSEVFVYSCTIEIPQILPLSSVNEELYPMI